MNMKISIPDATAALKEGTLEVEADSLTIETSRGKFEMVLLMGGGIGVIGQVSMHGAAHNQFTLEIAQ